MHQGSLSRVVRWGVTSVALVSMCACSIPPEILELEVSTWWDSGSEQLAFDEVKKLHEQRHPEVRIESTEFPEADEARDFVARNVLAGAAPDTFQANIGADLISWTMVDTANEDDPGTRHIEPLDTLLDDGTFWNRLPPELVKALRVGELPPPYAVPINIHRLNLVYFRPDRRERYEHDKGAAFLDLGQLCPANGEPAITPPVLALGGKDEFPQILLLFENLIPALAGPAFYEAFFRGEPAADRTGQDASVVFERALRCLQRLGAEKKPGDADYDDYGWKDALNRVRNGDADYTVMGDWANGYILEQRWGDEIASMPFPGTEEVFVFTSDTFPLPVSARHPEAAKELLRTIASKEAQKAFSEIKGSIPARDDVVLDGPLAELAHATRIEFERARFKVMATSGYFPPYLQITPLSTDILSVMNSSPTGMDSMMDRLRDYEDLFREFQARIGRGPSPRY